MSNEIWWGAIWYAGETRKRTRGDVADESFNEQQCELRTTDHTTPITLLVNIVYEYVRGNAKDSQLLELVELAACTLNLCSLPATPHTSITYIDYRKAIVEANGIPALVKLADTGSPGAREAAVLTLPYLAQHDDNRMKIENAGGIKVLFKLLECYNDNPVTYAWGKNSNDVKEAAAIALGNLARPANNIESQLQNIKDGGAIFYARERTPPARRRSSSSSTVRSRLG